MVHSWSVGQLELVSVCYPSRNGVWELMGMLCYGIRDSGWDPSLFPCNVQVLVLRQWLGPRVEAMVTSSC